MLAGEIFSASESEEGEDEEEGEDTLPGSNSGTGESDDSEAYEGELEIEKQAKRLDRKR